MLLVTVFQCYWLPYFKVIAVFMIFGELFWFHLEPAILGQEVFIVNLCNRFDYLINHRYHH